MDEIKKIASETLTDTEKEFYNNSADLFIIKTILLYNSTSETSTAILNLDGVNFQFSINANETKIINSPIASNIIKAKGNSINIHISGIQLGE